MLTIRTKISEWHVSVERCRCQSSFSSTTSPWPKLRSEGLREKSLAIRQWSIRTGLSRFPRSEQRGTGHGKNQPAQLCSSGTSVASPPREPSWLSTSVSPSGSVASRSMTLQRSRSPFAPSTWMQCRSVTHRGVSIVRGITSPFASTWKDHLAWAQLLQSTSTAWKRHTTKCRISSIRNPCSQLTSPTWKRSGTTQFGPKPFASPITALCCTFSR
mmetsp:Transcript_49561/g.152988  ORF Transcript_49561/g.152988 Transcript_49561/m.152988 type:complete len:215 (+) Transcript_49561:667-1311(+)